MRSRVISVQNSGIYIGGALSSFSVILIKLFGWRACYNMMGLSGVAIGLSMLLFVKNPERAKTTTIPAEETNSDSTDFVKPESKNVVRQFF